MKLTVIGAGCWGLTLAWLLTNNFEDVCVWSRTQDMPEGLAETKCAEKPVRVQLQQKVEITDNLSQAVQNADIILLVVATGGIRPVCQQLKEIGLKENQIIVNASKGIELPSLLRMTEVIKDELPNNKIAVLSGPTLAVVVLNGKPTAASIACNDIETAKYLQKLFHLYCHWAVHYQIIF